MKSYLLFMVLRHCIYKNDSTMFASELLKELKENYFIIVTDIFIFIIGRARVIVTTAI